MERPDDEAARRRKQEIADVIHEEVARLRRVDSEEIRRRRRFKEDYREAIRNADEATFLRLLSAIGWEPGSPEYEAFVRAWRALRR